MLRTSHLFPIVLAAGLLGTDSSAQGATGFQWQLVGDQSNPDDPLTSFYGKVFHAYSISRHEVTYDQYAEFLNAVASLADPYEVWDPMMESDPRGGMDRNGSGSVSSPWVYTPKANMGNKPVTFVSFFDTLRYANWLHNGGGDGDTETGAYTLGGFNPEDVFRNADARYFLPSEDEWYKAAYYGPDVAPDHYWVYPFQSNSLGPIATATATGDVANPSPTTANYELGADWAGFDGQTTTVGSAGATSYYGCADMGGNVMEWTEGSIDIDGGLFRNLRGGAWLDPGGAMASTLALSSVPQFSSAYWGFRIGRKEGNPHQSLKAISGTPKVGTTMVYEIDNALGTQAIGSFSFLAVATQPAPEAPHGTLIPGFSMFGPGQAGELFISFAPPNPVQVISGLPWLGPGSPGSVSLSIPADPTLVGQDLHLQGLLMDLTPGAAVPFGLTNHQILFLQP